MFNKTTGGVLSTIKLLRLLVEAKLNSTEIGPVVASTGTVVVRLVAVAAVTVAWMPLNFTRLSSGIELKSVPIIVTVVPSMPTVGVNPIIVKDGITVKLLVLEIVTPFTVTEIFPEVAPSGTVTVMLDAVEAVVIAGTPLKLTILSDGVVLKFVPSIVIVVPTVALDGLNEVMVGDGSTTKFVELCTVTPLTVTETFPVVAPAGTVVVILVEERAVITAGLLLKKDTWLLPGIGLKFTPLMVTTAPTAPLEGVNPEIAGVPETVKLVGLDTVTPFTVTDIEPLVAPNGT